MTVSPTQVPVEPVAPVDVKPEANAELRAHAERTDAENVKLREQVMATHIDGLGLKTDEGLGKAIVRDFKGEITAETVTAYAKSEYSYEAPVGTGPVDTAAADLQVAQDKVDAIGANSSPVTPQTRLDKIANHDVILAKPEATRADAEASIGDKLEQYISDTR